MCENYRSVIDVKVDTFGCDLVETSDVVDLRLDLGVETVSRNSTTETELVLVVL